jgi:hypothetical protein
VCLGMLQEGEVVLGALGCPNLPHTLVVDKDGQAGVSDEAGTGCLFLAHRCAPAHARPARQGASSLGAGACSPAGLQAWWQPHTEAAHQLSSRSALRRPGAGSTAHTPRTCGTRARLWSGYT